jgi:hypothetical protein
VKKVAVVCLLVVLSASAGRADIIYFKDGLKTICQEKTWEEDGQVKCEYRGWIITYQKSDILRILKTTPPETTVPGQKKPRVAKKIEPAKTVSQKSIPPDVNGLRFYDPQRPDKYWTDKNTRHQNYQDAIQALARKYDRSPEWIQANMGQTNDLSEIHQNLQSRHSAEISKTSRQ